MPTQAKAKGPKAAADEKPEVSQRDQVRQLFGEGTSRSQLAEMFGLKYQQIYAMTKDLQAPEGAPAGRPRVMVEVDGELRPRVEVIRERFAAGEKIGAIAKDLGISYQIVYQATKGLRAEAAGDESDEETEDVEDVEETEFDEDEEEEEEEDEDE
jgi:DNA invertase Pin-like site-specific DNA recombinase